MTVFYKHLKVYRLTPEFDCNLEYLVQSNYYETTISHQTHIFLSVV